MKPAILLDRGSLTRIGNACVRFDKFREPTNQLNGVLDAFYLSFIRLQDKLCHPTFTDGCLQEDRLVRVWGLKFNQAVLFFR